MALAGDTIADVGNWVDAHITAIDAAANSFVGNLVAYLELDYTSLAGGLETLNYLQWDYDAELSRLQSVRPGYITNTGADAAALADRLDGLAVPTAPTLNLPESSFPTLDAERPVITMPALPGTDVGDAPSDAPVLDALTTPDAPTVTIPDLPTFEELQIPVAPSFSIPSFDSEAPVYNIAPPTAQFSFVDAGYTSSLRDPLVTKLLNDLQNGGYGIDTTDEQALWTRARDRAEAQGRQDVEAAYRRANATNFPMPTGALYAAIEAAKAAVLKQLSEANRDIALKRADMYVENRRFTIEQVREYEKVAIDLYNAVAERALNSAKATVELGVATFDATVRSFSAQLDAYKTDAQVFETRIRAELTKAEVYKAQIDAERLRGEFNAQRVALYQAQLNGIQSVVNLYKNRVEAVNVLAQVQAQRIEIFKSRVQAYATRVQAKAAEYDMYRAAVQGETAKLDIYRTDISAYETRIRAEDTRVKALLQNNTALVDQYRAQVAQYQAQLEGAVKRAETQVEIDKTSVAAQAVNVQVYRALTDAVLAGTNARIESQKMNNQWNIQALNSRVEAVRFRLQELQATVGLHADVDKFGAKYYGDQLTAALANVSGLTVKTA